MRIRAEQASRCAAWAVPLLAVVVVVAVGCAGCSGKQYGSVDVAAFKKMARGAQCADIRNRLFVIDEELVLRDKAGNCADAAYSEALYAGSPDQELCVYHDSIAGPVQDCWDAAYQQMFETILANLDKADLGLGPEHTVEEVGF